MEIAPDPHDLGDPWLDGTHAMLAYDQIDDFDVVHDHAAVAGPVAAAHLRGNPPVVHTLHGPWTPHTRRFFAVASRFMHLVAISDAQRADNPDVTYADTVHNGIDVSDYRYRDAKDDFLVYIGRANPDKGPREAIDIARRAGLPLHMILKRGEPPERAYFEREIAPHLGADIELYENVSHETKVDLLARARAMVFPIRWPEPFGLVMVEAMACGTPVVTTNWGAAPELVVDGVTGFRRESFDDLVDAVRQITAIEPAACRQWVEEQFSGPAMVRHYETVYGRITGR
jgi:glycosyltransferase involved in cell wall biosynthesis